MEREFALTGREVKEVEEMLKKEEREEKMLRKEEREEELMRLGLFSFNTILLYLLSFFADSTTLGLKLDIFHSLKVFKAFLGGWGDGNKIRSDKSRLKNESPR